MNSEKRTIIDLCETHCPETFLYAKLAVENHQSTPTLLELRFHDADTLKRVAESLLHEGLKGDQLHKVEEGQRYALILDL